ncbi:F-box/LRR-repeat protein [Hibiscus syriacus]|uniref:F-box/LRR-repeat protein n=1 Tax=Hibiscus syriacus TaxID=106335 RepID=A0A6A3D1J1_HIBSY|nr:F-box/LRR-repeat protein [Hibiscus syriacus]
MEHLPIEVIGNILSWLEDARDVVIASVACRKWREAYRTHLHTLAFNSNDWPGYRDITASQLEILITQTIFQTTGLQNLSILMDDVDEFNAATVIAWLMYTRGTLRRLFYKVRTSPNVNILEICGRQKLEILAVAHRSITGVEPNFQKFPCLKSLSLSYVSISDLDLRLLLTACPKLECLELVDPEITISDAQMTLELSSPTLKEYLCTLKYFKFDDVIVIHLDICETVDNLEVVDVSSYAIFWTKFYQMISRSSKLRKLRLWDVAFDDEYEVIDLETIAVCFPQLNHLSLRYELRNGVMHYGLQGSSNLETVRVLELGWTVINDLFYHWVEELLKRCPNLRKMIIFGVVSEAKSHEECQILANFTSPMVQLMRKYIQVEVQFEYE